MPEDMTNTASDTEAVNPTEVVDNSPAVPISEGVSRDNDASDDAILDRLMGEKDAFEAAVESAHARTRAVNGISGRDR